MPVRGKLLGDGLGSFHDNLDNVLAKYREGVLCAHRSALSIGGLLVGIEVSGLEVSRLKVPPNYADTCNSVFLK